MALQSHSDRPYFSYLGPQGWLDPSSPDWSADGWFGAESRGPKVRPVGNHAVVVVDDLAKKVGSIHLPTDSMVEATTYGTVLIAPATIVEYRGRLRGGVVDVSKLGEYVEFPSGLRAGQRVFLIRFAGITAVSADPRTLGHDRIRLVPYSEIMAVLE